MAYSLDPLQDGCYENSSVLINKFNIRDEKELEMMERNITGYLMAKASIEIPFENADFEFYKNLHKYVFDEIYDWAGTVRKVNISKSATQFCPADQIEERAKIIFDGLKAQNYLKDSDGEDFINEFADLYCELNYLHPFREGNGRLARTITAMQLCRARNSTHLIYALNTQILKNRDEYLSIINKTQCGNGDITGWILWFLNQVESAVHTSENTLEPGLKRFQFQARHSGTPTGEREQALLNAVLSGSIPRDFTAKDAAALFGTSHDTALREIQSLMEKGLVAASKKGGRSKTYSVVV